ncbi:P-loop NTPase [Candidatus Micrarchaeota archaeon]|nr:P-loop NTPase [Candidatus Micrarchaeota archaeon]
MRSIVFCSGKGGVGKSSIALNLGLLLAQAGKKVVVVDADVSMANLALMMGIERTPITLNHVLSGENVIEDALYDGPEGMKYVPAELSTEKLSRADYNRMKQAVVKLEKDFDFVLLDAAPGWMQDAKAAMNSVKEAYVIVTPEPICIADGLKAKNYLERRGTKMLGVIINMALNDPTEIRDSDIKGVMGMDIAAKLPEDLEVRRASASQKPVVLRSPNSPFVRALSEMASKLAGKQVVAKQPKVKKGLIQSILDFFLRKGDSSGGKKTV